ncbi:MAG: thioredoxin-like protein [Olpidium bornovanus]|uniref:thioredoxin-dependent peroxiredoxin n=1 Tax=Olpidium bornovanus TaxID=278681 RepID=A0A8H8DKS0_9FUNG|nr:MAG: thioredoxin-like protein [Olpidium bornovanus]
MPRKVKDNEASATGAGPTSVAASRPRRACVIQNPPNYAPELKKRKADSGPVTSDAPAKESFAGPSKAGPVTSEKGAPEITKSGRKKDSTAGKGKGTPTETKLNNKEAGANGTTVAPGEGTLSEEKENGGHKDVMIDKKGEIAQEEAKVTGERRRKVSETNSAGLQVGDALPDLKLADNEGKFVSLHELVEESGVVIYAYPKANTPGCTQQSLLFKEHHKRFLEKHYRIFGISGDSTKSQASWKNKLGFPFSLLSDLSDDCGGLKQLGFLKPGSTNSVLRSHIVVAKGTNGGRVEQVVYGVKPKESAEKALQCIDAAGP